MFERSADDEPRSSAALPGLDAQARGVARDVRPVLVDDRHDAERHARAHDLESVRAAPAVEHLADRVGQRSDSAQPVRHPFEAGVGEAQPVERARGHARGLGGFEVGVVRGPDLVCPLGEQVGRGEQGPVLGRRRRPGEQSARGLGPAAELDDGTHPARLPLDPTVKSGRFRSEDPPAEGASTLSATRARRHTGNMIRRSTGALAIPPRRRTRWRTGSARRGARRSRNAGACSPATTWCRSRRS